MKRLLLLTLLVTGCHGHHQKRTTFQDWVGHTRTQVIERFGAPTSVFADGGLEVLNYQTSRTEITNNPATVINPKSKYPVTIGGGSSVDTYTNSMLFWIDANGRVVKCVSH